jgi:hypothetical protein
LDGIDVEGWGASTENADCNFCDSVGKGVRNYALDLEFDSKPTQVA